MYTKEAIILAALYACSMISVYSTAQAVTGTVYVKLDFYRQMNRASCDSAIFGVDYCDPYFIISVSSSTMTLNTFASTEHDNSPKVLHFGKNIGQLPNPLPFHFTRYFFKPNDRLEVSVVVKDKDQHGTDDHMTDFKWDLNMSEVTLYTNNTRNESWPIRFNDLRGSRVGHMLRMAVWIMCSPNYYHSACSVHCNPEKFKCSSTGSPICPSEYMYMAWNESCVPADRCLMGGPSYCQNGGTCIKNPPDEATCQCPMSFTGPRCQLETHPCHRNITWCRHGVCRALSNDSSSSSECICDDGFTGHHCDEDVDECRMLKSLCGIGGDCVNSIGSFKCVCKPGFSGALCQVELSTSHPSGGAAGATATTTKLSVITTMGTSSSGTGVQVTLLHNTTISVLLLVLLILLICAVLIGFIVHRRRRASNETASVLYRVNAPQSVSIEQPQIEPVESTYYEEIDNDTESALTAATSHFTNAAYSKHEASSSALIGQSRSFSKKHDQQPPQPPPRGSNTAFGMDPYLVPRDAS